MSETRPEAVALAETLALGAPCAEEGLGRCGAHRLQARLHRAIVVSVMLVVVGFVGAGISA
jgi:hypothetical protein